MGRQDIRDGALHVRRRRPARCWAIPLHNDLRAILAAAPREHLTFLTTRSGSPFTGNDFSEQVSKVVRCGRVTKSVLGARAAQGGVSAPCRSRLQR